MEFTKLFDDDRAVSPVIGVILMVAITVILAAVIGTFVLGLGDQVQNTTPQASFGFESSNSSQDVTITHESGDTIAATDLSVSSTQSFNEQGVSDSEVSSKSFDTFGSISSDVSAGSSVTINGGADGDATDFTGATIRVIYDNPDSDKTATLAKKEY